MNRLLLDTCAVIWFMDKAPMSGEALSAIAAAALSNQVFVSPISAWEISLLARKGKLAFDNNPEKWFDAVLALEGVNLAPMPPRTLIASTFLPGNPPNDPSDRIVIATARAEDFMIVTRDLKILDYAGQGEVRGLGC